MDELLGNGIVRKGQPERTSKLQKAILWELKYDEEINYLRCFESDTYFECNYNPLKLAVAEKYGGIAKLIRARHYKREIVPAGFSVSFHNSLVNLYVKDLVELSGKENKKGICQIVITDIGEEVVLKCFNNKKHSFPNNCFNNKKPVVEEIKGIVIESAFKLSGLEFGSLGLGFSVTQGRRIRLATDFARKELEMVDRKEMTFKEALQIAEKRRFEYILDLLEKK